MGWLIAFGVLTLLAALPLGVTVVYNMAGTRGAVILGPFRIPLFPRKKKKKVKKKEKLSEEKRKKASSAKPREESKGGSVKDFLPLVQVAQELLGAFRRKLRVNRLELKLILGGDDPCDLGRNYARAWAALGNLMPRLERLFVIKKRDLEVECDFTATQTLIFARLDMTMTLGRLLTLLAVYGFRAVKEYLKIMKMRKGGGNHEPKAS